MIDEEIIKKVAVKFEKEKFSQIFAWVEDLRKNKNLEYLELMDAFYNYQIQEAMAQHKVSLAIFLADSCKVAHTPDDRSRIVFTLANVAEEDFPTINQTMARELGPYFKILEKYEVNGRVLTWKEVALRAKEIQNGYQNHAYLTVVDFVDEAMVYYRNSGSVNNLDLINKLSELGKEICEKIQDRKDTIPYYPQNADLLALIEQFYKLSNRLNIDTEKIYNAINFDEILAFVQFMLLVCETKVYLYEKKIPWSDLNAAKNALMRHCAATELEDRTSIEEMERAGKPLEPKLSPVPTA